MKDLRVLGVVALVAAGLGAGLRADGLDRRSFSRGEADAVGLLSGPPRAMIERLKDSPFPPLYYVGLRGWIWCAGSGDVAVRFPAFVFGLLALPATYLAWRPLVGRRAALWALALLALNAFHIWYSSEAKMYSLVWLLATLSSAAFLRAVLGLPGWSVWHLVYAASTACLPLISYVGVAPLMVQIVYGAGLAWRRVDRRAAVLRTGLVAVASLLPFLLWSPVALRAATERTGIRWIPPVTWGRALPDVHRLFGVLLVGYETSTRGYPAGFWRPLLAGMFSACTLTAGVLLGASLLRSFWTAGKRGPDESPGLGAPRPVVAYLALWLVLPVVEALVFSLNVYPIWGVPRHFAGAAPALVLWLAVALGSFRRTPVPVFVGPLLIAGNLLVLAFDRAEWTRIPWREVVRSMEGFATTLQTYRGAPGAPPQEAGEPTLPVVLSYTEDKVSTEALLHAAKGASARVRVIELGQDGSDREPFFVLSRLKAAPRADGSKAEFAPYSLPGYTPCRVRSDTVYQDRYSSTPSPFTPTVVELWVYYPTGQALAGRR